jgi:hypothetical protein
MHVHEWISMYCMCLFWLIGGQIILIAEGDEEAWKVETLKSQLLSINKIIGC